MVPEKITFIPVEIGSSVLWLTGRDAFFFPLGYHYAQVFPPYGECYVINDMATLSLEIIIIILSERSKIHTFWFSPRFGSVLSIHQFVSSLQK